MDGTTETIEAMISRHANINLVRRLGAGAMGDVFYAELVGPEGFVKPVAVKLIHPYVLDAIPDARARFIREARVSALLEHPNIVQTHQFFEVGGQLCLVMEYVDGRPLSKILSASRRTAHPIPHSVSLQIVSQVLAGLHWAHEAKDMDGRPMGIVHRDLKPSNIILDQARGLVKILDFGVAHTSIGGTLTQGGDIIGTLNYMSPEQASEAPDLQIDRRSDLFSAALILFELLAGAPLYQARGAGRLLAEVARADVDRRIDALPVARARPELDRFLRKALAKDREQRYQTAEAMADALNEIERRTSPFIPLKKWLRDLDVHFGPTVPRALPVGLAVHAHERTGEEVTVPETLRPPALPRPSQGAPEVPRVEENGPNVEKEGQRSEFVDQRRGVDKSGEVRPERSRPVERPRLEGKRSAGIALIATIVSVVILLIWIGWRGSSQGRVVREAGLLSDQRAAPVGPSPTTRRGETESQGENTGQAAREPTISEPVVTHKTAKPSTVRQGSQAAGSRRKTRQEARKGAHATKGEKTRAGRSGTKHNTSVANKTKTSALSTKVQPETDIRVATTSGGPNQPSKIRASGSLNEPVAVPTPVNVLAAPSVDQDPRTPVVVDVWLKAHPAPKQPGAYFLVAGQRVELATKTSVRLPWPGFYTVIFVADGMLKSFTLNLTKGGDNRCVYFPEKPPDVQLKCRAFEP